ncbi:MAG: hypothetical protein RMN25_04935 [Anaerolineae bacterium]|nr:hypothetical protein [Thermoflexales bacterium]MDW8407110.1 hypothetical protein [Anaerolineae bacterium]
MNWKAKVFLVGGVIGLIVGLAAAALYARTIEQSQGGRSNVKLPAVQTGDLLRIAVSVMTLVRTIAGLADES